MSTHVGKFRPDLLPHLDGCPGSSEWITVEWIGVEKSYPGNGVARCLLQEQLRFHAGRGVNNVIV